MPKGYKPVTKKQPAPAPAAPTISRKQLLTAEIGALTTQLGTIDFNAYNAKLPVYAKIAELMREVQAITKSEG